MKVEYEVADEGKADALRRVVEADTLQECEQKVLEQKPYRQIKSGRILERQFTSKEEFESLVSPPKDK